VRQIAAGAAQKLTLLAAPAGFGKTTLLTQWIAGLPPDLVLAWLALDTSDNEPGQFIRHLVAALQRTQPDLGHLALAALLHGGPVANMPTVASLLVNDLATVDEPVVIVLDDYHRMTTLVIHEFMTFLLDHAPATLHLVLACRTDPPLPLARLRARGELVELRTVDLRLSADEAAALARQMVGPSLTPAHLTALYQRTEGWAAGLHLAALAVQRQPDPQQALALFSGQHRFVLDYVLDEVIRYLPPHLAAFLGQTAILSHMCAPLCDAVTQRSDSQRLLRELEQAHLFLEPLDATHYWYRCPTLFAEALRSQFQAMHPEQMAELHLRASTWYIQHGFPDEAIRHALAGGAGEHAAHLIEQTFLVPLMRGDGPQVLGWLQRLPAEVVAARPRLWLVTATAQIIAGQYVAADPWLDRLEHAAPEPHAAGLYQTLQAHNAYYHGNLATAIEWARVALAQPSVGPAVRQERQVVIPAASVILAAAEVMQGQLDAALDTLRSALQQVSPTIAPGQQLAGSMQAALHIRLAELSYEVNDLPAASRHARESSVLGQQSGYLAYHAYGLALLARMQQAQGQHQQAQAQMQEAVRIVAALHSVDDITYTVLGWSLQLAIAHQDAAAVEAWERLWADMVPADPEMQPPMLQQVTMLLHTRCHLFHQEYDAAMERLNGLRPQVERAHQPRITIEMLLLEALVWQARRHTRQAIATLAPALALAERSGFVRLLVDEGASIALLLAQMRQRRSEGSDPSISAAYLDRLLAVCAATPGAPARSADIDSPGTRDALSAREREVLHLLAAGLSNAEIAERLIVTPGTVKRHLHNLYSKLGVTNRTQAAAYARTYAPSDDQ
jgi:LuxR family maltose regulon positive regulatory protein